MSSVDLGEITHAKQAASYILSKKWDIFYKALDHGHHGGAMLDDPGVGSALGTGLKSSADTLKSILSGIMSLVRRFTG